MMFDYQCIDWIIFYMRKKSIHKNKKMFTLRSAAQMLVECLLRQLIFCTIIFVFEIYVSYKWMGEKQQTLIEIKLNMMRRHQLAIWNIGQSIYFPR